MKKDNNLIKWANLLFHKLKFQSLDWAVKLNNNNNNKNNNNNNNNNNNKHKILLHSPLLTLLLIVKYSILLQKVFFV